MFRHWGQLWHYCWLLQSADTVWGENLERAQDDIDDVNANPEIQVGALFRKYQLDFELYGYDPEPYFDIAIVEPDAPVEQDTEVNPWPCSTVQTNKK